MRLSERWKRHWLTGRTYALAFALTVSALAQPAGQAAGAPTSPATAPVAEPANAKECVPGCRDGYLCHEGQCISACNPPCPASEVCVGTGTCQATARPTPSVAAVTPPAAAPTPSATPAPPNPAPAASSATLGAPSPGLNATPTATSPAPSATPTSNLAETPELPTGTNLHVNALGLLQFGLIFRVEFGGATTLLLGVHFFNTGVLSYVVIPGDEEALDLGIGGNVGVRHYFHPQGAQAGAYLGGLLEYASLQTTDDSDDLAEYHRKLLIPAVDAGYRWVWGSFLLDLGGLLGAAIVTDAEDMPINSDGEHDSSVGCAYEDSCLEESPTTVFGMGMLNVGFFL